MVSYLSVKLVALLRLKVLNSLKAGQVTTKPVAAFVAGAAAPKGRKLGHAGAIVNSGDETADAKKDALKSAGVVVSDTITRIGEAMKKAMGV